MGELKCAVCLANRALYGASVMRGAETMVRGTALCEMDFNLVFVEAAYGDPEMRALQVLARRIVGVGEADHG